MTNAHKIGSAITLLASVVGIFAWTSNQYTSYVISDINSLYSNPTKPNPFAVSNLIEACNKKVFRAQMSALRAGENEAQAAKNARSKCKPLPKEDDKQLELSLSFTNKGSNSMKDISVSYIAINDAGDVSGSGMIERSILAGGERFHYTEIKVSSPTPKALICIQYESGLFRKSWKAYSGKPADAHMSMFSGGFGRFELKSEGNSWFFGDDCDNELEKLLTDLA